MVPIITAKFEPPVETRRLKSDLVSCANHNQSSNLEAFAVRASQILFLSLRSDSKIKGSSTQLCFEICQFETAFLALIANETQQVLCIWVTSLGDVYIVPARDIQVKCASSECGGFDDSVLPRPPTT